MLFRAIFWITVVALFMPHGQSAHTDVSRCQHIACSVQIDLLERFKATGLQRLKAVRARIEDAARARKSG
jgi:hypothetical protein